ncbi:MAG: lysine-sensitive aspartokinase 3 [Gemmatimonadales bacterium]|nr:lysine-sensitive aspartokinase 3 [Gemmatimonadales bacterium]
MIVAKFGGTSVGDATAIRRLVEIIRQRLDRLPLVVVSAMAGVTDGLLELVPRAVRDDQQQLQAQVEALESRHRTVSDQLSGTGGAMAAIADELAALGRFLAATAGRPLEAAEIDRVVAHGEIWSSRIVSAALANAGIRSTCVLAPEFMRTDSRFGRARPDRPAIERLAPAVLLPPLREGIVLVTQGFIGATAEGAITTLGRGGSDFSAALLGAALSAECVEIWTDVSGLMTADPRIVPAATTLAEASYEEAAELATFGAKVLHPATQAPLVERGIPIRILNSLDPSHPGTLIGPEARLERLGDSPIRSISYKKGITALSIRAPRMLGAFGFLRALFEVFERHEVVVDVVATSEVSVSLTIEDPSRLSDVRRDLEAVGELRVDEGRCIVAVVGIGLRDTAGVAARVFRATQPANVEIISQGASAINITFVTREAEGPEIVRRLHREFFGT